MLTHSIGLLALRSIFKSLNKKAWSGACNAKVNGLIPTGLQSFNSQIFRSTCKFAFFEENIEKAFYSKTTHTHSYHRASDDINAKVSGLFPIVV